MRWHSGILAALAAIAGCRQATPPDPRSLACDVAAAHVQDLLAKPTDQPWVFTLDDENMLGSLADGSPGAIIGDQWIRPDGSGQRAEPPPEGLVAKLRKQGYPSAIRHCPALRALLDSRHVKYGAAAVAAVVKRQKDGVFPAAIEGVSLPAVSDDGTRALFVATGIAGMEGGGGSLVYAVRDAGGRWRPAGWLGLWIS
jgi:hypothetical protein